MTQEMYVAAERSPLVKARLLLACGVAAGPVYISVVGVQALTRDGFDLGRHPISLLSLGSLGWVQVADFIVGGLLSVAFAAGLRRVLHPGPAGTWAPPLVGVYGIGLIAGGVFVTDPALGFPPGAPLGTSAQLSWHATLHAIAPPVAFTALVVACLVFVRRFAMFRRWGWAAYSAVTAATALTLAVWPGEDGLSVRLAAAVAIAFAWTTAVAARLMREVGVIDPGEPRA